MILKISRIKNSNGEFPNIPKRATKYSAGIDLAAFISSPVKLKPLQRMLIPTGIIFEMPTGYAGFIYVRSSLGTKYGICLSNGVGVIDSDFRGEIKVGLINLSNEEYLIKNNDRIAQIVISPVEICEITLDDNLSETTRNIGGFGSTGK